MPRVLNRHGTLRIFDRGENFMGLTEMLSDSLILEWVSGQPGHPSSYGLLGGHPSEGSTRLSVAQLEGAVFTDALTRSDRVRFGLPEEYRENVLVAAARSDPLDVTIAANAEAGSSIYVFGRLVQVLNKLVHSSTTPSDDVVWNWWNETA